MTTKFRSACDRCHDAKVRCSGDMPCQGCIVSKTLCFYSISNVLGRPRGTKNKTSRRRVGSSTTSDGPADADITGTTSEQTTSQRLSARRRRVAESRGERSRSESTSLRTTIPERQDIDGSSLVGSESHTPTDNPWFLSPDNGDFFNMPDIHTPTDFRLDYFTPITTTPVLGHTPPMQDLDAPLDASMTDLSSICDVDTTMFPWEGNHYMHHHTPKGSGEKHPTFPPSPESDSSASKTPSNICTCLQQHAELLSSPSIAEMNACSSTDDAVLSLDKLLSLANQGIKAWRSLIECTVCPYNTDQEAMLLALMSIRPVTRYLQRLAPRYKTQASMDPQTRGSATLDTQRAERTRLMLGNLEVEDEERMLVYRLLFQKTVQKVRQALHSLQMMQYKRKKELLSETNTRAPDFHASSSLSHTQQITHALATALQDLESSFTGTD